MSLDRERVCQIHSTTRRITRFPFREMATVIDMSRSGESTRGHAATPNDNYRKLLPTLVGWPLIMPQRIVESTPTRWGKCAPMYNLERGDENYGAQSSRLKQTIIYAAYGQVSFAHSASIS